MPDSKEILKKQSKPKDTGASPERAHNGQSWDNLSNNVSGIILYSK